MRLSLHRFETGVETIGGNRVVYDVANDAASFGRATVEGRALVWQLDRDEGEAEGALVSRFVQLDPFAAWIVRCDRIDFPLGGIAHRHTHPGPGIRYLLHGELEIETEGAPPSTGPGGAWFESGPDPVVARASSHVGRRRSSACSCSRPSGRASGRSATSTRPTRPAEAVRLRLPRASDHPAA